MRKTPKNFATIYGQRDFVLVAYAPFDFAAAFGSRISAIIDRSQYRTREYGSKSTKQKESRSIRLTF